MNDAYGQFHKVLDELLVEKEHAIEPPPANTDPLFLLLTSRPDLIGFAKLNGEGKAGVDRALENFKSLYVINSSKWAAYDLTLVLCRTETSPDDASFWSEIELDPYFCRKFVIDVTADVRADLGRLPFIPLRPETVIGFERPPSAQTLLIDHGVRPWLAEALAVPHRLSEKRIVEECLRSSAPKFQDSQVARSHSARLRTEPRVRLRELEISNFRAYRDPQKFDLDANLVVLYGPNGLGKTSFFDAIDFACTGGVTRLDERFGRKSARLVKSLRHLDSMQEDSFVKAGFVLAEQTITLARRVDDRTNAMMNDSIRNRTDVLGLLTACSSDTADMRVDNLIRLFRATHLFGQEYHALTLGLRDESKLPQDTVSRMLAFQDYVEAMNKAERVSKELRLLIDSFELQSEVLDGSLDALRTEQSRFKDLKEATTTPESIETAGKKLFRRITNETDLILEVSAPINQEEVKTWRAQLEGRIASVEGYLLRLRALRSKLPEILSLRTELALIRARFETENKALKSTGQELDGKKKVLDAARETRNHMLATEKNTISSRESYRWLLGSGEEYRRLRAETVSAEEERRTSQRRVLELTQSISHNNDETNTQREAIRALETQTKDLQTDLLEASELLTQVDDWTNIGNRCVEIGTFLEGSEPELKERADEISLKKRDAMKAEEVQKDLQKRVTDAQQQHTDLQRLIESCLAYVLDRHCPVCGADHGSKERLEDEIRQRIGSTSMASAGALEELRLTKAKTEGLKKEIRALEIQLAKRQEEISARRNEVEQITNRLVAYRDRAAKLELPIDKGVPVAELKVKRDRLAQRIKENQVALVKGHAELKKIVDQTSLLSQEQRSINHHLNEQETVRIKLVEMIKDIENEAIGRRLSIGEDAESVRTRLHSTQQSLKELQGALKQQDEQIAEIEKEYSEILNRSKKQREGIEAINLRTSSMMQSISDFEKDLLRNNLTETVGLQELELSLKQNEETLNNLISLQDEVRQFETVLDEAQISAALAKLKHDIDGLTKRHREIKVEQDRHVEWHQYFERLRNELEAIQKEFLKDYISKYGPLTSSIQKRLRAVYGFGDLQLRQEKNGIALSVERNKQKRLVPSDYFSESQIQIVTLSLFLSAVLTQTWSAFAPILLDDPVTHFDDLNAYSLLDVIRGLIDKPGEGHQFILSTCEERLYRLMRQKFAKLEGKAIYYEFNSIGELGPLVVQG